MHVPNAKSTFVNRHRELAFLRERAAACTKGEGSIVGIGGPAGIGKSRLIAELRATPNADMPAFYVGRCLDYAPSPLGPFADILTKIARRDPESLPTNRLHRRTLGRLIPDLDDGADEDGDKRLTLAAVASVLRSHRERQPYAMVVEDIHDADSGTLEVVRYLAGELDEIPVVIFLTFRTKPSDVEHPFRKALDDFERHPAYRFVELAALASAEIATMLQQKLPRGIKARGKLMHFIERHSEGNPLFVEELVRSATSTTSEDLQLPATLRAALQSRLQTLGDEDRQLLNLFAFLDEPFDIAFLAKAAPESPPFERVLDACVLRGIFDRGKSGFRFHHSLTREVVLASLPPAERRAMHSRFAEAYEAAEASPLTIFAHWLKAERPAKIAEYSEAAGDAALELRAPDRAIEAYEAGIATGQLERGEARVRAKLADAYNRIGALNRAIQEVEIALESVDGVEAIELMILGATMRHRCGDASGALEWARAATEAAERSGDPMFCFEAYASLGQFYALLGDRVKARETLTRINPSDYAPSRGLVKYYVTLSLIAELDHDQDGVREASASSLEAARLSGDHTRFVSACITSGIAAANLGDDSAAEKAYREALDVARREALSGPAAYAEYGLADLRYRQGDLSEARELILSAGLAVEWTLLVIGTAALGVAVGLSLDDSELAASHMREEILERAFATRKPELFGPVSASYSAYFFRNGDATRGSALLSRALDAMQVAEGNEYVLVAVAMFGTAIQLERAASLLAKRSSTVPLFRATYSLIDGALARQRSVRAAQGALRDAVDQARLGRLPFIEALAFELLNDHEGALAIYERIGARGEIARLNGARSGDPSNALALLSRREREVARLAADGRSNRDIASQLYLSERTVESHMAAALAKLDITSRTQLTSRLASMPLTGAE